MKRSHGIQAPIREQLRSQYRGRVRSHVILTWNCRHNGFYLHRELNTRAGIGPKYRPFARNTGFYS